MSDVLSSDEGGKGKRGEKKERALIVSERSLARSECQEWDKQHSSAASGINELTNHVRGAWWGTCERRRQIMARELYGGRGRLNSRLSLSAELAIELFCLAHIICHGGAGEKCLVPPVGRNSVSTSKIRGCVWNIVEKSLCVIVLRVPQSSPQQWISVSQSRALAHGETWMVTINVCIQICDCYILFAETSLMFMFYSTNCGGQEKWDQCSLA